jgi:DNA repair protein RecO (recombination protein O)
VVLRTAVVRDSDLVVVLLTAASGKVEAIARGARKSRKRFPGGLPVGARGEAVLAQGRGSLARLDGFTPTAAHSAIGANLDTFAYVAYLCELTDQLVSGSEPDAPLFATLCAVLDACIAQAPEPPSPAALRAFELALLERLGHLPALEGCAVCGSPLQAAALVPVDVTRGGVLCQRHAGSAQRIPSATLRCAQRLLENPADPESLEFVQNAPDDVRRALRDLCAALVRAQLRRPLRSLELFRQLGVGSLTPPSLQAAAKPS